MSIPAHLRQRLRTKPMVGGLVAAFVTAGLVSWATPDGNLVVTLVPALVVGLLVFGVTIFFRKT